MTKVLGSLKTTTPEVLTLGSSSPKLHTFFLSARRQLAFLLYAAHKDYLIFPLLQYLFLLHERNLFSCYIVI